MQTLKCSKHIYGHRGLSSDLYLDDANNFASTSNQLKRAVKEFLNNPETKDINFMSFDITITFHFNPPTASHMGGLCS